MTVESPGDTIIYRSRLNAKIHRNFEVFSATDFLARITNHIPDKGCQMVRYYGWYSNKMRGQRERQAAALPNLQPAVSSLQPASAPGRRIIRIPPPSAKRVPSKKWRDLILKVWHSDPMSCPCCITDYLWRWSFAVRN